jgi:hypothetical protein
MTQEEKTLLLQDLCARLPYGVIVDYKENEFEIPHWRITTIYPETLDGWIGYNKRVGAGSESGSRPFKIGDVKPYLRPMSSMTEEEKEELIKNFWGSDGIRDTIEEVDWYLSKHFDIRGLIEKGLAIEVTKENNPYK